MNSRVTTATGLLCLAWIGGYWVFTSGGESEWIDRAGSAAIETRPSREDELPAQPPVLPPRTPPNDVWSSTEAPRRLSEPFADDPVPGRELRTQDPPPATEPHPAAAERFHIVAQGDSLWKISERYYGSGTMVDAIFEANREILNSKSDLKLGQRLRLPGAPGEG